LVMGSDAAPAGVVRSHALGRSRVAVRAYYGALPFNGLDAVSVKAGESPPEVMALTGA